MCLKCHSNMSDAGILKQLSESLVEPKFDQWNTTSISHLCLAYIGVNGQEVSVIGKQLLDNYVSWKTENGNSRDGTFFGNPTVKYVNDIITGADKMIAYMKEHNITDVKHAIYEDSDTSKTLLAMLEDN